MVADRDSKCDVAQNTGTNVKSCNGEEGLNSLADEEELVEIVPHRPQREKGYGTEETEACHAGCLLLLAEDGYVVLQVVADPQRAVDHATEEHTAPGPTVKKVQPFITVPWAEEQR